MELLRDPIRLAFAFVGPGRASISSAPIGLPNNLAEPSVTGNSPVIIFMVVVFPQPFEPRNPKISPRSMRTLTWSTATKSPNRRVNPSVSIAAVLSSLSGRREHDDLLVLAALFRREQEQ